MLGAIEQRIPFGVRRSLSVAFGSTEREKRRRAKLLKNTKSVKQVLAAAESVGFTYFTDYAAQAANKKREFSPPQDLQMSI